MSASDNRDYVVESKLSSHLSGAQDYLGGVKVRYPGISEWPHGRLSCSLIKRRDFFQRHRLFVVRCTVLL